MTDAAAMMDHRLRRLSTILWVVGGLFALLATNTPGGRDYNRLAINVAVLPAVVLAVSAIWYFPWHRYHRNIFLVTIFAGVVVVALMVAWSGGWHSPFVPCFYFIVVFAALYLPRYLALAFAIVVTFALASPLLFGFTPPGGAWALLWLILLNGATALAITVVGRSMADEMLRLYGETVARLQERQRAEAALQVAHDDLERRVMARTAALARSEERYRELFDNASDIVYTHDLAGRFTSINMTTERLTGYTQAEALRLNIRQIVTPEDWPLLERLGQQLQEGITGVTGEVYIVDKTGRRMAVEVSPRLIVQDGRPVGVQGIARDISERKRFEAELRYQAFHDPLTGLPNRVLFLDRLEQIIQHAERHVGYQFAVLFLDLDRFKIVNDSLGHLVGDRLLTALAERLQACLRPGDTVARLGGDEFAILLPDLASVSAATDLAERLGAACRLPFNLDGHEVRTATSIGIVLGPGAYRETEALLRDADSAMYTAKAQGKARHVVFSTEMHVHALALMRLEHDLRCALEAAQFSLHYQPIVALDTGHVTGFEALVRWQHPQRGMVSPGEFIPLAEETGLIVPLGWWVIEEACRQLCVWHQTSPGQRELSMSINLSAAQFTQPDLVERIQGALQATGLAPEYLLVEITESAIMANVVVATDVLMRLKALGIRLAVDDFGTGYSSLAYLKRFPVDMLKIDKAFVDGLGIDTNDTAIVRAIISLAHTLGLRVTAEGVERAAQAVELHALGCELGQGYHFGKPQPADRPESLLTWPYAHGALSTIR